MTKERPIIFSGEMVRAILDGRKTQTRRVWKQPTQLVKKGDCLYGSPFDAKADFNPIALDEIICPYGRPGDRLWVRETFGWGKYIDGHQFIEYRASPETQDTDAMDEGCPWKPSIYMPRTASRIDLLIKSVRVERLNDLSDADALEEGIDRTNTSIKGYAIERFKNLWKSINGSESWDMNPWVWVIEFERVS